MNIAIFYPYCDIATNPNLTCLVSKFTQNNCHIDIFTYKSVSFPNLNANVSLYYFPKSLKSFQRGIRGFFYEIKQFIKNRIWKTYQLMNENKYQLCIGINPQGIIAAYNLSKQKHIPLIYISYEIFFQDELTTQFDKKEKELEINTSKHAKLVIIQDKIRGKLLANENGLNLDNFFYLPVTYHHSEKIISDFLRNKFNISKNKKIAIHSGSFHDWTYANELIDSVKTWPEDMVLVIHTRWRAKHDNPYIQKILNSPCYNKSLYLSTEPLDEKDYEKMVASADIGLVLYKPIPGSPYTQKNIANIGLSSGKFACYMKHGLPTISIKQETYANLLKNYNFGENIESFAHINAALRKIAANYDSYHKDCLRIFKELLDFDLYWPALSDKLKQIIG